MKRVFRFFAIFNFVGMIGTVGGMEHSSIGLLAGIALSIVFSALMVLFCKLGGMFYENK